MGWSCAMVGTVPFIISETLELVILSFSSEGTPSTSEEGKKKAITLSLHFKVSKRKTTYRYPLS